MVMVHPLLLTQQYRLASVAFKLLWQLSSTGISHHSLLPHIPLICLSAVNSNPCPGIAPQSLNSTSQLLHFPGDLHPCPGYLWLQQGLSAINVIPFRLPQINCFTLCFTCFSFDPDNCPTVGIECLLQFPHLPRAGPVLLMLLFSPQFLHPTEFCVVLYILFPLVRDSCPLPAGVLHALLCLEVYS